MFGEEDEDIGSKVLGVFENPTHRDQLMAVIEREIAGENIKEFF